VSLDPRLGKILRFGLIGCGALAAMSGIVNIAAAWQLIDPSAEASLGITRNELIGTYAALVAVGAAMIFGGFRLKK
jgi:hypothetical protein